MARLRFRASFGALALVLAATGCKYTGWGDAPTISTAHAARNWLVTQQQTDGGFEVSGFPGFETSDAALAIAEDAQQQLGWDTTQARTALQAVTRNGKSALDALDDFADGSITAGQAAKLIVLVAKPMGYNPTAFNPQNDATSRNLVQSLQAGAQPDGSYGAFNATLYAAIAQRLTTGQVAANTLAYIRGAQEGSGGWDFAGDPTGADADVDTTGLALQALVAANVAPIDLDLVQGLQYLVATQGANGAWQSFGTADPNSTSAAVLAITATGFDPRVPCWRNAVAPGLSGTPYGSPISWLRSQSAADGHIVSANDAFPPINTFATSQTVQALRRGWLPVATLAPKSC